MPAAARSVGPHSSIASSSTRGRSSAFASSPACRCANRSKLATIFRMRSACASMSWAIGRAGWFAGRSASISCAMPSTPASGLLISCATPAPSSPSAASARERSSMSWAWRSSRVPSSTRFSSVWFQTMISLVCARICRRAAVERDRHRVEGVREIAELVGRVLIDARFEVAGGDLARAAGEQVDAIGEPARERARDDRADHARDADPEQRREADAVHRQQRRVDGLVDDDAEAERRDGRERADDAAVAVVVLRDRVGRRQLALARGREALHFEVRDAEVRAGGDEARAGVDQLDVGVGRRARGDVGAEALERDLRRQDALAAAQRGIERDRDHRVRHAPRSAQEDRPDALAAVHRLAERRHEPDRLDVEGTHRLVVAEAVVGRRVLHVRRRPHRRAVLVEHRDRAEVVALVIDQLQELQQALRRRRLLARAREVEDARVDAQDRRQVLQLGADVVGDLARDGELVVLDRAAQRALADAQRRVARDCERNRRHAEGQERELGEQLHGAGAGSSVNASTSTESRDTGSCALMLKVPVRSVASVSSTSVGLSRRS